jgi:hypothetical protein
VEATEDANLYLYFQVDGGSSKNLTISSYLGTHDHSASHPCILDLGYHEKGETVNVTVPFEQESGYVTFEVCTMDRKLFERGYKKLQNGVMTLTEFEDTKLTGTFTAKKKSILYLSVPDDSGWLIELDGEPLKEHDRIAVGDALIGVRAGKGNHTITMRYEVPGGKGGLIVSGFTLFVLLCVWFVLWLRRKRGKKPLLPAFPRRSRKVFIGYLYPAPKQEPAPPEPPKPKKEVFAPPVEVIELPHRKAQVPQEPPTQAPQEEPQMADAPQEEPQPEPPTEAE